VRSWIYSPTLFFSHPPPPPGLMQSWMLWLSSSGHRPPLWWPWSFRPLALGSASRQSCLTSLLWRYVRRELLLCVPVGVLDWQSSVMEGPSSVWFLIIASLVRWSRGGTLPALGRVPCIPSQCRSLRSSLLCFHVALAC
jgi:hypothetical protein